MVEIETMGSVVPFWDSLSEQEKRELAQTSHIQSFTANECIHDANQACIGVFFVLTGSARAYMLSEEGREVTLFRVVEKESCVLSASCVMPLVTFDILVEASEYTELIVLPSEYFGRLIADNPVIESYTYKQATMRFSEVMWAMQQLLFMRFEKRLAIFLLDEAARTGDKRISLTHEEIARNIGSAREVVTRTIKSFASAGLVESFRGGVVILDRQRLLALSS